MFFFSAWAKFTDIKEVDPDELTSLDLFYLSEYLYDVILNILYSSLKKK